MPAPAVTCCTPYRVDPRGGLWRHDRACPVAPGARISVDTASAISMMRRVGIQKAETARAGIATVYELDDERWRRRNRMVPTDCDWHEGIDHTTSGICAGPRCAAYWAAHVDDKD